ncbi:MAG: PAS domain S-box protein [Halanaeroarchaeum sp.]
MVAPGASVTVLHVDDDEAFATLTKDSLERIREDFEVRTATSTAEGLSVLADAEVDCVVSDYEMAPTDGLAFLREVREDHPDLPFVLFTGKGSEEVASEAISAGVTDYIHKEAGLDQYTVLANRIENAVSRYRAERTADTERDRVEALFDNMEEAIAYTEFDGETPIVQAVNPAFEDVFGYDEAAVVGEPIDDVIVPETAADEAAEINERVHRGERVEYRVTRETADGPAEFVHRSVPIQPEEDVDRAFGIYRPIDEGEDRERARALAEEREKYQTLVENSNDGIVVVQGSELVTVNREFATLVHAESPADVEGEDYIDFVAPEYRPTIQERYEARLAGEEPPPRYDIEILTLGGERVPVELNMSVINYDGDPADMAVVRDIRDRKQRERALSELHQAATSLEAAEDREGVYQTLVDAAEEILDFALVAVDVVEDGALVQRAWTLDRSGEGYYTETPLEEDTLATRAYRRNETIVADDLGALDITPADPEYRSALTVPIGDVGTFQTVSRDVGGFDETDRELAELLVGHAHAALQRLENAESLREQRARLQRENERLDAFASIVSHDLRNPLNVATGRVDLASDDCESEHLETAAAALERMDDIVDGVLTWAREGQHVDEDEREPVALDRVANACWRTVETEAASIEVDTDRTVSADESRLQHVFENLFRNAIEYGSQGSESNGSVTIEVGDRPDGFYVADDGPGIPDDVRERVFDYGYSTPESSTGFGLAIVKDVVEAHGWTIRATEGAAGGARFEIGDVDSVD